jgi:hypothetical protein
MYWKKWKLVRSCGTPTKDYLGQNGMLMKDGSIAQLKNVKYEFVLMENGAVGLLWGFGQFYGPFFGIIDHRGWEVQFKD